MFTPVRDSGVRSYISPAAAGIVVGFGVDGYAVALHGLHVLSRAEPS